MMHDAREQELASKDAKVLQGLCDKAGIDPFVKEVIVDRIVKCENLAGRFAKPTLVKEKKEALVSATGGDMVDALIASEANRKRERELQKQEEEAAAKRRAELKAMEVTELKKLLQSTALELSSKREDMVETFLAYKVVSRSMQRSRRGRRSGRKRLALSSRTCVPAKTSSQE